MAIEHAFQAAPKPHSAASATRDTARPDDFCVAAESYYSTVETPAAKGGAVHAALVTLTIDPEQAPAAANALVNDILPRVRSALASLPAIG